MAWEGSYKNDVWHLEVTRATQVWTELTDTTAPGAREFHATDRACGRDDGRAWWPPGDNGNWNNFDDLWLLNVNRHQRVFGRSSVASGTLARLPRHGHTLTTLVDGTVVMFGGAYPCTVYVSIQLLQRRLSATSE